MKIRVEHAWCGGDKYVFIVNFPGGGRERLRGEEWTPKIAAQALDIGERLYYLKRRNIRFAHR